MKVAYSGPAQHSGYSLGAKDFAKAGVEGVKATFFPTNEAVEVDDEVGDLLISKEGLFGDIPFTQVEDDVEEGETSKKSERASKKAGSGDSTGTPTSGSSAVAQGTGDTAAGTAGGTATRGTTR